MVAEAWLFWSVAADVRSLDVALYWWKCIEGLHSFVHSQDKASLEIVVVPSIMVKDPSVRPRKKMGPMMDRTTTRKRLSVALKEEDEAPLVFIQKKKEKTSTMVEEVSRSDLKQKGKMVGLEKPKNPQREGWS